MRFQSLATAILLLAFSPLAMAGSTSGMGQKKMNEMESQLEQMEVEIQAIAKVKDPKERRAVIGRHLNQMNQMIHGLGMANPSMCAEEQDLHILLLEERVDLLQMLMTHMIAVHKAAWGFPGPLPTD